MSDFIDPTKNIKSKIKLLTNLNKVIKKAIKNKPRKRIVLKSLSSNDEEKKPRRTRKK